MKCDDDIAVVRQAIAGHRSAQGELARRAYPCVLAFCLARVGQRADAEELTQETLLRSITGLSSLNDPERWMSWMRGIAVHVCVDWLRRNRKWQTSHVSDTDELAAALLETHQPDQIVADREEQQLVRTELQLLPEDLREVLVLYYFNSMTYEQIADWLDVARATVSERLSLARQSLRLRLSRPGSVMS
jgi:RNA polymerase sigma-70 factor (ECF subfamily)